METSAIVGGRLKRWRGENDWTGPEAAEKLSASGTTVDWPTLYELEQGNQSPAGDVAKSLADLYGHTVDELLDPTSDEPVVELVPDDRPEDIRRRSPYRAERVFEDTTTEKWDIQPGQEIRRSDVHKQYGGARQGIISQSRQTPNVLLFSDPTSVSKHGFTDQWEDDTREAFLFYGEGQTGDQELVRGNGAILKHRKDKRALRMFEGAGGIVRYAGQFEITDARPYTREMTEPAEDGSQRRVLMFRLRPLD